MKIMPAKKNSCIEVIRDYLTKQADIDFAYIHGSFAANNEFNDIDVAVFTRKAMGFVLDVELSLESALESALAARGIKIPVDVRVLNAAPLAFRFRASKDAIVLFSRDDAARADFESATRSAYFDYAPLRDTYLAEVFRR